MLEFSLIEDDSLRPWVLVITGHDGETYSLRMTAEEVSDLRGELGG